MAPKASRHALTECRPVATSSQSGAGRGRPLCLRVPTLICSAMASDDVGGAAAVAVAAGQPPSRLLEDAVAGPCSLQPLFHLLRSQSPVVA
jgi:hypothetical protein